MKFVKIKPVATMAYSYNEKGEIFPCARILGQDENGNQGLEISPILVTSLCISLYDAFLKYIPENSQNEFEETFIKIFNEQFKVKDNYIEIINQKELLK